MYIALEGHCLLPSYCKILLACDVHIKKQLLILDKVRQQLYTNQSFNSFYSPRLFRRRQRRTLRSSSSSQGMPRTVVIFDRAVAFFHESFAEEWRPDLPHGLQTAKVAIQNLRYLAYAGPSN